MTQFNEIAIFAGGCFWCSQMDFDELPGVLKTTVGYDGGHTLDPTYESVCAGKTGYAEAIQIEFDPSIISYEQLLEHFWKHIDPTVENRQFNDVGTQYRTAIFYLTPEQQEKALVSKNKFEKQLQKTIVTQIMPSTHFYPAEEHHQSFYQKNPGHPYIQHHRFHHEEALQKIWAPKLTPLQEYVTQACGTEPPFQNEYWDNHEQGLYVDIISGEPLFCSRDKFDSGSGWPSFTKPIRPEVIFEKDDSSHGMTRTEVRSQQSHLGHVFDDGPQDQGGLRYCINSAALRFIAVKDLDEKGYGEYKKLFE